MSLINRFNQTEEDQFSSPTIFNELFNFVKHFLSMDKEDDSSIGLLKYKSSIAQTAERISNQQTQNSFIDNKSFNTANIPAFMNAHNKKF
ncbi:MAG: hypothetical protein AB7V50_04790 [Vampirovibrionia bacterium]